MCGIVGFIDHRHSSSAESLEAMTAALEHRGPDSSGVHLDDTAAAQVGLGHRRLSILDLSELGQQPMAYEQLHIIHNGEVYNFEAIKEELTAVGYSFTTHTDTEVILKAFHAWGISSVEKFRGMFAFVIYDTNQQKLFMFRDRAGVKPFYYYAKEGIFLFASELKAFHKHKGFSKRINKEVIPAYMRFGYIPAPYSIFDDTYKLKAGHYLEYDLQSGTFEVEQYWDVNAYYSMEKTAQSEETILQCLEQELNEAFKLRMVSDVPVGVFLSGGVDSSLITALLQEASDTPLKTFTIGFDEPGYNEAEHAREIADYLKTDHTEYYCSKEDALNVIPNLPRIYDEPFGDSSAIATILVSKLAREKVSVVLSGDGGDEVFCGYSKYFALNRSVRFLSHGLRKRVIRKMVNMVSEDTVYRLNSLLPKSRRQTNIRDKLQKLKRSVSADTLEKMFIEASSYVDVTAVESSIKRGRGVLKATNFDRFTLLESLAPVEQMMAIDYQTFMVDDILTKVDRATMSQSLEGREPLLDHKITEFMARVPVAIKYKENNGKYLLKKILHRHLPGTLFERPKSGFQVPLYEWLKSDLRHLLDRYLDKERLEQGGIFDAEVIEAKLKRYYSGGYINISEIWFILMFEMWREEWDIE